MKIIHLTLTKPFVNGSNIYLVEQMEKHHHRIEKLKSMIKCLGKVYD